MRGTPEDANRWNRAVGVQYTTHPKWRTSLTRIVRASSWYFEVLFCFYRDGLVRSWRHLIDDVPMTFSKLSTTMWPQECTLRSANISPTRKRRARWCTIVQARNVSSCQKLLFFSRGLSSHSSNFCKTAVSTDPSVTSCDRKQHKGRQIKKTQKQGERQKEGRR